MVPSPHHHPPILQGLLGIRTKVELNGVFKTPGPSNKASGGGGAKATKGGAAEAGGLGLFEAGGAGWGGGGGLRKDVQFKTARVDFGGFQVTFPHMDIFGVQGWLETTFVDGALSRWVDMRWRGVSLRPTWGIVRASCVARLNICMHPSI